MLMSHHDVVDGGEGWETDPFTATEKDGYLFGRGTIDTKTPLFAELMALEELLSEGFEPAANIYIGSSNNEECSGDGMVLAAEYFKKEGIFFDTVLDEGGAITEGMIPGVKCKSAVVAVHEKSRHLFKCITVTKNQSGHGSFAKSTASAPERMSRFITEVCDKSKKIYKAKFYPEVRATFERHVPYMSFPMNFLFGNVSVFSPLIKKIMVNIPAASAMLTTSVTFTNLSTVCESGAQTGKKEAEATMYLRCIREDDLYRGLEEIKKIAEKYGIEIEETLRDYCKPTDFSKKAFCDVEALLHKNFPDVAVAPFLLTAGTDARRLTDVAENILRFAPIDLSRSQFSTIHGANENIKIQNIGECVEFYKDFIRQI